MQRSWRAITAGEIRLALIAALLSTTAFAAWPLPPDASPADYADAGNWPNDPQYAQSYWEFSFKPSGVPTAEASVGNGFDRAWSVTRGAPGTIVAVIGGRVSFDDRDLVNRWALSRGELPPPQDAQGNISTGADPHDRNGDGRFNAQDFTSATGSALPAPANVVDPRLSSRADKGDVNGNGILDPEDLRAVFANGVDDDGNGAIDDVCGFGAPSAFDRTELASLVAAEANNGLGGAGACPDCAVLPFNVSSDPVEVARAIQLAVRAGAKVIVVGVQTFGPSPALENAAADALQNGALVIAPPAPRFGLRIDTPADEPSFFRSNPLGPTGDAWSSASSFSSPQSGCGQGYQRGAGVVAPDCAASAAILGGAAALLFSRGAELSRPISPVDVKSLLLNSRIDVRAALDQLAAGSVPAALRLNAPLHAPASPFEVTADVTAKGPATIIFEAAPGLAPSSFQEVHREELTGTTARATIDPAAFTFPPPKLGEDPFAAALTVRVRAESHPSDGGMDVEAIDQRLLFIGSDAQLLPAFPISLSTPGLSVRLVDVDGDGSDELVVLGADGTLNALDATGTSLSGFPVQLDGGYVAAPPAIGDLNGDGRNELVVTSLRGQLDVIDGHGATFGAFPIWLGCSDGGNCGAVSAPVIADTPNGSVIVQAGLAGRLHVLAKNGAELQGSPVELGAPIVATPAVGDVDNDGWPEIVIGTTESKLFVLHVTESGVVEDGQWPRELPGDGGATEPLYSSGIVASPLIANLDRDGEREIVARAAGGDLQIFRSDGTPLLRLDQQRPQQIPVSAAVCDLNGDGLWELADAESGAPNAYTLNAWEAGDELRASLGRPSIGAASEHSGFPIAMTDAPAMSGFAVADMDGDGAPELLFGGDRPLLYAISASGVAPAGWPKQVPCGVAGNVTVGAMNNRLTVAALSKCGELYAWNVTGVPENIQWDGFHHDPQNTGSTSTPLPKRKLQGIGIDNPPGPAKGCCSGAPGTIDVCGLSLISLAVLRELKRRRKCSAP